jgi:hypothetical protein
MFDRLASTRHASLFFIALFAGSPALAQDEHQSHVPVPPAGDGNPATLFHQRIQEAQQRTGFGELLKQLDREGSPDQQALLKYLHTHPELAGMVGRLQAGDPEITGRLRQFLEGSGRSGQLPGSLTPEGIVQLLKNLRLPEGQVAPQPPPTSDRPISPGRPTPPAPPLDPAEQDARRHIARHLAELAERFPRDHLPDSVRHSPAVQDFFRRLGESASDALRNANSEGLDAQLAKLERGWKSLTHMLPKQVSDAFRKLRMPDLPRMSSDVRVPRFEVHAPSGPSLPRLRGASISELGPAANAILVAIGVAILLGVFWRLRGSRSRAAGGGRPLGRWPLDPGGVSSRSDLIRAFEYLSLLRCGEPARAWHHHAIANCLGGDEADRRAAADRLAQLYEQARYAPTAVPEPDWTAARGPLSLLAGVG